MYKRQLYRSGLVAATFGNVSGIDRDRSLVAIKPSGVSYESLTYRDIVVLNLDGVKIEGRLNPSSDTKTHLEPVSYTHLDVYKRQVLRGSWKWVKVKDLKKLYRVVKMCIRDSYRDAE